MGEYFLKNCVSFTPGINPSRCTNNRFGVL